MWGEILSIALSLQPQPHKIHLVWLWALLPTGLIGLKLIASRGHVTKVPLPQIGRTPFDAASVLYLHQSGAGFVPPKHGLQLERLNRKQPEPLARPVKVEPSPCKGCGNMDVRMTDIGYCVPCVKAAFDEQDNINTEESIEEEGETYVPATG